MSNQQAYTFVPRVSYSDLVGNTAKLAANETKLGQF